MFNHAEMLKALAYVHFSSPFLPSFDWDSLVNQHRFSENKTKVICADLLDFDCD